MRKLLQSLFNKNSSVKKDIPFSKDELRKPIEMNRASLLQITDWIDEEAFGKSWFQYGVPDFILPVINRDIGPAPTYSDLMVFIGDKFFKPLNYLEIGVSVGKNFYQLLNAFSASFLTGFDIEEINPVLEGKLILNNTVKWETPLQSIKKSDSSLKNYNYRTNQVNYLCADIWDENSWAKLKGNKYNIIFSDALHSSKAILFEFEMLVKYQLLDEKFVIFWDDLAGKMETAFFRIIRKYHKQYEIKDSYLLKINGWIGEHESPHSVGMISNFPLT